MKTVLAGVTILATLVLATGTMAGTNFNAGIGGLFVFDTHTRTATGTAVNLGVTYRPIGTRFDILDKQFDASRFMFWSNQSFQDGETDYNLTGVGFSLYRSANFEIISEAAAVTHQIADNQYQIGAFGGFRLPMTVIGNTPFEFRVGGGWDGGEHPLLLVSLGFLSN